MPLPMPWSKASPSPIVLPYDANRGQELAALIQINARAAE
jgi:hypothetical protein